MCMIATTAKRTTKGARRREKEREIRRVLRRLVVSEVRRDKKMRRRRIPARRASGGLLADVRGSDGKRAFWVVSAGELGTLVACRRPIPPPVLSATLGLVEPLSGEVAMTVNNASVLPWRPELTDADADPAVAFARVESPLYGTLFLVCGGKLAPGPLGVSSRGFDRLCTATRSMLHF